MVKSDAQRNETALFLHQMLLSPDHGSVIENHCTFNKTLAQYLEDLLLEHQLKKSKVIAKSGLNTTFGYQIFSGARNPSRNKVISLAFGMGLSLEQTQLLLYCAGLNSLYAKNRRDALIIWGITCRYSLPQINEQLYRADERMLSKF